jgi:hypothetical protein
MVNTFILTNSPKKCVKLLDYKRLGKQRVEAKQIIDTIENDSSGWKNHPVTKMWKDNIIGLKYYLNCCIDEWILRGYNNTMEKYDLSEFILPDGSYDESSILPWFYFNLQIQESFKASLLRKDPSYYTCIIDCDPSYMYHGYIWISKLTNFQIDNMKKGILLPLNEICEKFGSGTPPQYRLNKDLCIKWIENKSVNPLTKRKIKSSGTIYKDFEKASLFYKLL